jgi:hypothetical protein
VSRVAAFGEISLSLAGGHTRQPGGGNIKDYAWWQARGFDVSFELVDAERHATSANGDLYFLIHRRPRPLMHPPSYAADESGIAAARARAGRTGVAPGADDLFYKVPVAGPLATTGSPAPVAFHEERPVLRWPVGVQMMATFRITAWFVPAEGPILFAERDVDLFWANEAGRGKTAEAGA